MLNLYLFCQSNFTAFVVKIFPIMLPIAFSQTTGIHFLVSSVFHTFHLIIICTVTYIIELYAKYVCLLCLHISQVQLLLTSPSLGTYISILTELVMHASNYNCMESYPWTLVFDIVMETPSNRMIKCCLVHALQNVYFINGLIRLKCEAPDLFHFHQTKTKTKPAQRTPTTIY